MPLALIACDRRGGAQSTRPKGVLPTLSLPVLASVERFVFGAETGACLINFWATWCPPCRAEMASLNRLYRDWRARGLKVVAVSVDSDLHLIREYLVSTPLDFPVLLDPEGEISQRFFDVEAFPTTWLVDRHSSVHEVWLGERDWDDAQIRVAVEALLAPG